MWSGTSKQKGQNSHQHMSACYYVREMKASKCVGIRTWCANGTEEASIECSKNIKSIVRHIFSGFLIPCSTPIELGELEFECLKRLLHRLEDIEGNVDYLLFKNVNNQTNKHGYCWMNEPTGPMPSAGMLAILYLRTPLVAILP